MKRYEIIIYERGSKRNGARLSGAIHIHWRGEGMTHTETRQLGCMPLFGQGLVLRCSYGPRLDITRTEVLPEEHDEAMKGREGLKFYTGSKYNTRLAGGHEKVAGSRESIPRELEVTAGRYWK